MASASNQNKALSSTQRALAAIQHLQAKIDALEAAQQQPIAIIGIGCRFPGGADTPARFWQLLQAGQDAITEIPSDRWDVAQFYHPSVHQPGKMCVRQGGFVPHLFDFDAKFFRISPREAISLDPQQRLLLEVSWEALEHAALAPDHLADQSVGVFVGISAIDYWHQLLQRPPAEIDAYLTTGNTHSVAAGRLSYWLGIQGPSLAVDTACSSALTAVHLACQSLRQQECDIALAGGVNRILMPEISVNFSQAQMLSPDGRCKSFDARADGFGRAEGCGVIVLKRLADAMAAQDAIRAVIVGSAINHTGRTSGLTVPNGPAQQQVIRRAMAVGKAYPKAIDRSETLTTPPISPAQIDYIEAHGTGTALGDPIELGALDAIFSPQRSRPLWVGSVKTNIGHLEAAAGIAGLIKTVLALQHQAIPPNLHYDTPTPHLDWHHSALQVPTQMIPWPSHDHPRHAGVSAFGFNGANAHIVLAEAPAPSLPKPLPLPCYLLTLSAHSALALQNLVHQYAQYLSQNPALQLADVCATANHGRAHFNHRLAIIATTCLDLQEQLAAFEKGSTGATIMHGRLSGNTMATITVGIHGQQLQLEGDIPPSLLDRVHLPLDPPPTLAQWQQIWQGLAHAYLQGASINWRAFICGYQRTVELPTYPFQREHYICAKHNAI